MNKVVRFAVLVAGLLLIFGAIGHAQLCDELDSISLHWQDSTDKPFSLPELLPLGLRLCILEKPDRGGLAEMKLRIIADPVYDSFGVVLSPVGRLQVEGPVNWLVGKGRRDTLEYQVRLIIPDQDTSGIEAEIMVKGRSANATDMYFVTTGDTLEVYYQWPKPVVVKRQKMIYPWGDTLEILNDTSLPKLFLTPAGDTLSSDTFDLWYKREKEEHIPAPDTINIKHETIILPEGILARTPQGRKELMERVPFLAGTRQVITVDGQLWVRDSGEYKFRPGLKTSNGPAYMDSVMKAREEQGRHDTVHVVLDLRSPADYDTVKRAVDALYEMDRPGFYHAVITREVSAELERIGIVLCRYPYYPDVPPRNRPKPAGKSLSNAQNSTYSRHKDRDLA